MEMARLVFDGVTEKATLGKWCALKSGHLEKNIYIYIQKRQSLNEAINLGTFHSLTYWVLFLT